MPPRRGAHLSAFQHGKAGQVGVEHDAVKGVGEGAPDVDDGLDASGS
ncbi:hypothetical protein ACWGJT_27675 [Streptomyces xantholiticus]